MKNVIISIILLTCAPVQAKFFPTSDVDGINDKQRYLQRTYSGDAQFGFRCDTTKLSKTMYVVFGNTGSGHYIAAPNSKLDVKLRVDGGKVYTLNAVMSNSSNRFVFIPKPSKSLLNELKAGNQVHVRAHHRGTQAYEHVFSLSGSSKAIDEVSSRCDVLYKNDSYSRLNREIMQLKRERDMEIRNIERIYSQKIAEIRAQYH
ncbi:hypothetical protein AB4252_07350 [Vibrio cyclitrophicus]